jgi:hypothetical protein
MRVQFWISNYRRVTRNDDESKNHTDSDNEFMSNVKMSQRVKLLLNCSICFIFVLLSEVTMEYLSLSCYICYFKWSYTAYLPRAS